MASMACVPPMSRSPVSGLRDVLVRVSVGTLSPVLDRTFPFDETLDARVYVEQGRANGKIVVNMVP
jgi:NADPH:quinone reductase-like Zn-dependent oxidoreductase